MSGWMIRLCWLRRLPVCCASSSSVPSTGGFLVGNYVKVVGGSGPVLVQIPMRSFGIPADEVSARTLGMAMESILEFDRSHVGVTVSRVSKRAWKQVSMRVTGKPESQWKRCCVTFNPHSGWTARSDVVSLRWSGDVDSRLNDVGTVVCPCGAGVGELGGMVLESFARVDAWCARNGRNPYTGMPCPLREDLGGDGVLVLTPPAYFQEDYAPGPGGGAWVLPSRGCDGVAAGAWFPVVRGLGAWLGRVAVLARGAGRRCGWPAGGVAGRAWPCGGGVLGGMRGGAGRGVLLVARRGVESVVGVVLVSSGAGVRQRAGAGAGRQAARPPQAPGRQGGQGVGALRPPYPTPPAGRRCGNTSMMPVRCGQNGDEHEDGILGVETGLLCAVCDGADCSAIPDTAISDDVRSALQEFASNCKAQGPKSITVEYVIGGK